MLGIGTRKRRPAPRLEDVDDDGLEETASLPLYFERFSQGVRWSAAKALIARWVKRTPIVAIRGATPGPAG